MRWVIRTTAGFIGMFGSLQAAAGLPRLTVL